MVSPAPADAPGEGPAGRLRAADLRVTRPRLAVLAALDAARGHPDVEEIATDARQRAGSLSTQAVYDILRAFSRAGLVRRLEPAGSPTRYETRVGDNHHHLVCRRCGVTRDTECATGSRPPASPRPQHRPRRASPSTRPRSSTGASAPTANR